MWGIYGEYVDFCSTNYPHFLCPPFVNQHPSCLEIFWYEVWCQVTLHLKLWMEAQSKSFVTIIWCRRSPMECPLRLLLFLLPTLLVLSFLPTCDDNYTRHTSFFLAALLHWWARASTREGKKCPTWTVRLALWAKEGERRPRFEIRPPRKRNVTFSPSFLDAFGSDVPLSLCCEGTSHLHSTQASRHGWGFVNKNLGSSPGLLGQ